jgi:hypothetical protein
VGNGIDSERLLGENAKRLADKWEISLRGRRKVVLRSWTGAQRERGKDRLSGAGDRTAEGFDERLPGSAGALHSR